MTRLGVPSCFGVTSMRLHQESGVLTGMRSITPSLSSLSNPAFTSAIQWEGTTLGEVIAVGVACSSTKRRNGGASDMVGRICCSQQLKAELLNLSRMYYSTVGSQGMTGGSDGGGPRLGHLHGRWCGPRTPVFLHLGRPGAGELALAPETDAGVSVVTAAAPGAVGLVSHPPTEGKLLGMQPRALQASSDRYIPGTVLET